MDRGAGIPPEDLCERCRRNAWTQAVAVPTAPFESESVDFPLQVCRPCLRKSDYVLVEPFLSDEQRTDALLARWDGALRRLATKPDPLTTEPVAADPWEDFIRRLGQEFEPCTTHKDHSRS